MGCNCGGSNRRQQARQQAERRSGQAPIRVPKRSPGGGGLAGLTWDGPARKPAPKPPTD